MNPAIEALAKVISSEALVQIKCEHEQRDYLSLELQVQLDLFAALMFHGVVSESPEEVADILVSDFRNTIQGRFGKPRIPGLEKDIKQIFVKIFTNARESYIDTLKTRGVKDPDALPRIPLPAVPKL